MYNKLCHKIEELKLLFWLISQQSLLRVMNDLYYKNHSNIKLEKFRDLSLFICGFKISGRIVCRRRVQKYNELQGRTRMSF